MTYFIIGATLSTAIYIFAFALARASAQADRQARRAHVEHMLLRYQGGERPCVVCGEPTAYSLHGRAIHPTCREDAA